VKLLKEIGMDWSEYYEIRDSKYAVTESGEVYQVLASGRWLAVTDIVEAEAILDYQKRHKESKETGHDEG